MWVLAGFVPPLKTIINFLFIVLLVCFIVYLSTHFKATVKVPAKYSIPDSIFQPPPRPTPPPKPNYAAVICDDAWDYTLNHAEDNLDHFPVQMREKCFSGFIFLPRSWRSWSYQHAPGSAGGWVAFWYVGQNPTGPLPIDDTHGPNSWVEPKMRIEGKGTLILFRTDK